MSKKFKFLVGGLITVVILIGILVAVFKGFKIDLLNLKSQKVIITLDDKINEEEIREILSQVLDGEYVIQDVEIYGDSIAVTTKQITDEQKETLVEKINEKYFADVEEEDKFTIEDLAVIDMGNLRIRQVIRPVVVPICVSACIIVAYFTIKYKKQNPYLVIIKSILTLGLTQVLILSIIAIARIPIGDTTIPLMLVTYILASLGLSIYFQDKQEKVSE